jgi:hypothetical protein
MNLQGIASPVGDALWVSGALPGSARDKKAEWVCGAPGEPAKSSMRSAMRPAVVSGRKHWWHASRLAG